MDYQMNVTHGFDFKNHSTNSSDGPIVIKDSILYVIDYIPEAQAQFDDITFQGETGKNYATIAKYVDTAFMTPYVAPVTTGIPDERDKDTLSIYPNPANDKVQFVFSNEMLLKANAISMLGQRTPLNHNGLSVDVSPLTPGIYILEIHTSKNNYKCKFIKY